MWGHFDATLMMLHTFLWRLPLLTEAHKFYSNWSALLIQSELEWFHLTNTCSHFSHVLLMIWLEKRWIMKCKKTCCIFLFVIKKCLGCLFSDVPIMQMAWPETWIHQNTRLWVLIMQAKPEYTHIHLYTSVSEWSLKSKMSWTGVPLTLHAPKYRK